MSAKLLGSIELRSNAQIAPKCSILVAIETLDVFSRLRPLDSLILINFRKI
jgi:hypothetical protein